MFRTLRNLWYLMTESHHEHDWHGGHDHEHGDEKLERLLLLEIRELVRAINRLLDHIVPRPTRIRIRFIRNPQGDPMADPITLQVGQTAAAKVEVLDQNGQLMPGFDFTANAPVFTMDNTAVASLADGSSVDVKAVTGVSAGAAVLTVTVPGVVNGSDQSAITVVAPEAVPTSVRLTLTPA